MSTRAQARFAASPLRRLVGRVVRLPARLLMLSRLAASRRDLARLDDHLMRDIGLTRAEAASEAHRPFWDAPSHWKA
ncbi:MAG: DUF1127 domain-containing protein [Hyphomonas sp.]|jgi:uncharacterized protein YjiS (DUF1127 family)|nr:DUF1127 domain-containing protein [Hyphomonas sp.]